MRGPRRGATSRVVLSADPSPPRGQALSLAATQRSPPSRARERFGYTRAARRPGRARRAARRAGPRWCGALAQVVRDHPHAAARARARVAAEAADEHVVAARRRRAVGYGVDQREAGHAAQQLARASSTLERLARLQLTDSECDDDDRDAGAGDGDRDRLVAEDLARLEHHLALFVGVVVAVGEVAGAAEDVERDRVRIDLGRGDLHAVQHRVGLVLELLDGG